MRLRAAVLGLLVLAGCTATQAARDPAVFLPDARGLGVAGSPLRVDFGRAPEGVIPTLTRELGPPRRLSLDGCPAGIADRLRWKTLELTFTAESFVGWRDAAGQGGEVCA